MSATRPDYGITRIDQPDVGAHIAPGSPLAFGAVDRVPVAPAPGMGEHTEEVLGELLGIADSGMERYRREGVL